MSERTRENLMAHGPGTPDTLLPPDPAGPGLGEGTADAELVAAVRAHPESSLAWALLAERALAPPLTRVMRPARPRRAAAAG